MSARRAVLSGEPAQEDQRGQGRPGLRDGGSACRQGPAEFHRSRVPHHAGPRRPGLHPGLQLPGGGGQCSSVAARATNRPTLGDRAQHRGRAPGSLRRRGLPLTSVTLKPSWTRRRRKGRTLSAGDRMTCGRFLPRVDRPGVRLLRRTIRHAAVPAPL